MTVQRSQPDNASLLAKIARLEQTIDTLENNARVQAKLLADTARSGVQSDYVMVPKSALAWLFGEGPDLDGKHFDECEDDATPPAGIFPRRYWWRSKFRALIASSVSSAPQDGVQTDAVAWRWRHVNDEKHEWRYQSEPIKNHTEYLEVEPLYASPLSSAESAIGFEEALYDFIKRYPQTLSYLAGRPYCKMSPCQLIEPSWGPCSQCADGATAVTSADRATGPICPYCFGLGKVETSALPSTTLGREGEQ